ncbi:MAG: sigma-70 family RNA polymerase sigma factor [Pirellulaceae bacterium]|jgi:RNA polymerase sigma-70 factor (ECF subfamily)|nr:sigma-70 family RNA polymerase sigma factor [Pirellulaceae bacterium]
MDTSLPQLADLLARARAGDGEAAGLLLEKYRPYLRILAERQLDQNLAARLDASDLVQQTCLSVLGRLPQFDGRDEAQFIAWLRTVHENNIRDAIREHLQTAKRAAGREVSVTPEDLAARLRASSPSQRVLVGESAAELAAALLELPPDQREAVRLRYLEGRSLAEIAERMERSVVAAAGLVKRGLIQLRKTMRE